MLAEVCVSPFYTAEPHIHIQKTTSGAKYLFNGMLGKLATESKQEGPKALFSNIAPALQHQLKYGPAIGLYVPFRNWVFGDPMVTG